RQVSHRAWRPHRRRIPAGARGVSRLRAVDLPRVRVDRGGQRACHRSHLQAHEELTMETGKAIATAAVLLACAHSAAAQQPPRPNEPPRGVTLPLAEYNRLVDLASRPPEIAAPPLPAVLASAELRVRVERAARG